MQGNPHNEASQAHIGRNHRMFSDAVTLSIQTLRKYAGKSMVDAIGLTRKRMEPAEKRCDMDGKPEGCFRGKKTS